jgi:hypothetical protein
MSIVNRLIVLPVHYSPPDYFVRLPAHYPFSLPDEKTIPNALAPFSHAIALRLSIVNYPKGDLFGRIEKP